MNIRKLEGRSSTTNKKPFGNSSSGNQKLQIKRCKSQVFFTKKSPIIYKFLYSKGKLIHSKLVKLNSINKKPTSNLNRESKLHTNELLELQELFRNKKSFDFDSRKIKDCRLIRKRLIDQKQELFKKSIHKNKISSIFESKFLIMKSQRSHSAFKVYEDLNDVFESRSVEIKDDGYFVNDNDIDTDEEQQSKGIRYNLDCFTIGYQDFIKNEKKDQKKYQQPFKLRPNEEN